MNNLVENTISNEKCTEYFGAQAEKWIALYQEKAQFRDRLALFVNGVCEKVPTSGKILGFGYGPGVLSMTLAEKGYVVVGVDGSKDMIELAKQQISDNGLSRVSFNVMDAESFSLPSESFDAVVCSSVLEYVENDMELLSNFVTVLKPGGVLFFSVPHKASTLGKIEDIMVRLPGIRGGKRRKDLAYSKRRYKTDKILAYLHSLSVELCECIYFEFPLFGKYGIWLSRCKMLGMMTLISGIKR